MSTTAEHITAIEADRLRDEHAALLDALKALVFRCRAEVAGTAWAPLRDARALVASIEAGRDEQ